MFQNLSVVVKYLYVYIVRTFFPRFSVCHFVNIRSVCHVLFFYEKKLLLILFLTPWSPFVNT